MHSTQVPGQGAPFVADDASSDKKMIAEIDIEQLSIGKDVELQTTDRSATLTTNASTTRPSKRSSYLNKAKSLNPLPAIRRYLQLLGKLRIIITHRWWWWELSSIWVSILTMMAVFAILLKINNTALSEWVFLIQPNSMVSIFMTISKSALLMPIAECISQAKWMDFYQRPQKLAKLQEYDEASRGPWGASTLLFSHKFVGWIAWLGALLTVVSLALDPFTQQILDFPSRHVALAAGIAELASTQSVDAIDISAMRGGILSSIYVPTGPESALTYKCSTSSCLWKETITSLGVCSVCHDITPTFVPVCTTTPGPMTPSAEKNETWSFDTTTCIYTIDPDKNITLTVYIQTLTLPAGNGRPAEFVSQYTQIKFAPQVIYAQAHSKNHLMSERSPLTLEKLLDPKVRWLSTAIVYTTLFNKDQRQMPNMTIQDLAPQLNVCGLYLCAQSYDHSLAVTNGTLTNAEPTISIPLGNIPNEKGLPTFQNIGSDDGQTAEVLAIRPESTLINFANLTSTPSQSESPGQVANTNIPSQGSTQAVSTLPGPNPPPTFTVSQQTFFSLEYLLKDDLLNISHSSGNIDFTTSVFPQPNSGIDELSTSASANLSDTFARIAQAITHRLRVDKGSVIITGQALVDETYFSVRWGWLGLPVGVLILSAVLLVGTILRSNSARRRGEGGIWKGNSLALLLHPLVMREGEPEADGLLGVRDQEGLERFADGVKVKLEGVGGEGGRLGFVQRV